MAEVTLVDTRSGHRIVLPVSRLDDFCRLSIPPIKSRSNFDELLGSATAASRGGNVSACRYGYRRADTVQFLQNVETKEIVPVWQLTTDAFISSVSKTRADMAGLRSKTNLTKFLGGTKITGSVRDIYGGWSLMPPGGVKLEEHLAAAPLPWDRGYTAYISEVSPPPPRTSSYTSPSVTQPTPPTCLT